MAHVIQRPGVAVVAMPLAAVDRRALSQAWFDALHLASDRPRTLQSRAAAPPAPCDHERVALHGRDEHAGPAAGCASAARVTSSKRDVREVPVERRAPRTALAKKIESRLAARPAEAPKHVTLSAADGRVQILVRGEGAQARIVAICAPALREAVGRALVEARYSLAARGVSVHTSVREKTAC